MIEPQVRSALETALRLSKTRRAKLFEIITDWIDGHITDPAYPNLADRRAVFIESVEEMVASAEVVLSDDGHVTLKVSPSHARTLLFVENGTMWFTGMGPLESAVLSCV